jgi:hypothetical protein
MNAHRSQIFVSSRRARLRFVDDKDLVFLAEVLKVPIQTTRSLGPDLEAYHRPGGKGYDYARRMALYDYRRHGGSGTYRVTLYRNNASDYALGAAPLRYEPERVLEFELQVGTETP